MLYIDGKLMKRQSFWRIICWNRWRNVEVSFFPNILGIIKPTKNTTTIVSRYVNELVSPRITGHLIEKKYQVTGHYLCIQYMLGCPELHFFMSVQWWNKTLRPVIERHHYSTAILFFGVWGLILTITSYWVFYIIKVICIAHESHSVNCYMAN